MESAADAAVLALLRALPRPAHVTLVWFVDRFKRWTMDKCPTTEGRDEVSVVTERILVLTDIKFHASRVSLGYNQWHLNNRERVSRILGKMGVSRKDMRLHGENLVGIFELFSSGVLESPEMLWRAL